jgi:hypothetical protein
MKLDERVENLTFPEFVNQNESDYHQENKSYFNRLFLSQIMAVALCENDPH